MMKKVFLFLLICIGCRTNAQISNKDEALSKISTYYARNIDNAKIAGCCNAEGPVMSKSSSGTEIWWTKGCKLNAWFFWIPKNKQVFLVWEPWRNEWERLGYEQGVLGAPTSVVKTLFNNNRASGWVQGFETGNIFCNTESRNNNKAYAVYGLIANRYGAEKWHEGRLGYPTDIERDCGGRPGRYQSFEHGIIYWERGIGEAYTMIHSPIFEYFKNNGWEGNESGFPASNLTENTSAKAHGFFMFLRNGDILYNKWGSPNTYKVQHGIIFDTYSTKGRENGDLGYPTSNQYQLEDRTLAQKFERGKIEGDKIIMYAQ